MIDRGVVRDLEDPRRELELGIVRADGIQDLDERLLRQVLGEGAVAHHAIQQRENGPLVAAHQLAERGFLALLGPRHDLRIAGAGQVARPIFRAYEVPLYPPRTGEWRLVEVALHNLHQLSQPPQPPPTSRSPRERPSDRTCAACSPRSRRVTTC